MTYPIPMPITALPPPQHFYGGGPVMAPLSQTMPAPRPAASPWDTAYQPIWDGGYGPPPQPMPPAIPQQVAGPMPIEYMAKDPELIEALRILEQTHNLPQDEAYLEGMGVNIIFNNGGQALDVIRQSGASVQFGDVGDPVTHAIWDKANNKIVINQNYRGDMSRPTLYAIAAALYHEAGHAARLGDDRASIQEEIDCLALNAMAYRAHVAADPWYPQQAAAGPQKNLFENGVALYPKLFFDPDPYKRGLVNRVIEKYGMLPPDSPDHPIPHLPNNVAITERVLHEIQRSNSQAAGY